MQRIRSSFMNNANRCRFKEGSIIGKGKVGGGTNKFEFSWFQVFLQWTLGMYVSTPLIAMLQGSFLLNDYRVNFSDAPRPLTPARGCCVAVANHHRTSGPSLRLLVVGDSLAAGVGVSQSGVPILPESIARALSKALGGRAGVSASQIVKDIDQIEKYNHHPKGRQIERIVKDFQARRRRWQQRHDDRIDMMGGNNADADNNINIDNSPGRNIEREKEKPINLIIEWWNQIRQNDLNFDEICNTTRRLTSDWWIQIRNYRKRLVEEDISAIKEIVQLKPFVPPNLNDDDDNDDDDYYYDYYQENLSLEDESFDKTKKSLPLVRKGNLFRKLPASEYDIAVVLTGLNDVKEAFMPHMNNSTNTGSQHLGSTLRQVLEALRHKMGGDMELEKKETRRTQHIRHPLVVVPELPVAPLQMFQLVPLCWFLVPLFRAMENNKRFLASSFPDYVVFVHQPDLQWWTDTEVGIGPIRENIKQEQLLLRVTDSAKSAREKIERLMKTYYGAKEIESRENNNRSINLHDPTTNTIDVDGKDDYDLGGPIPKQRNGSDLVSVDKMHPNDEGYELWGRHIAAELIKHPSFDMFLRQ